MSTRRQRQILRNRKLEFQRQVGDITADGHGPAAFLISKALHSHGHLAMGHELDAKSAMLVGDGPQTIFGNQDGGKLNGLGGLVIDHPA